MIVHSQLLQNVISPADLYFVNDEVGAGYTEVRAHYPNPVILYMRLSSVYYIVENPTV